MPNDHQPTVLKKSFDKVNVTFASTFQYNFRVLIAFVLKTNTQIDCIEHNKRIISIICRNDLHTCTTTIDTILRALWST